MGTNLSSIEFAQSGNEAFCSNQNISALPDFQIRISSSLTLMISPEQYTTQRSISSDEWCLDISLDWDDGVCLGSHAMEHYLILYDDEMQNIGVFDNNTKHQRAFDGDVDGDGEDEPDEEQIEILETEEERQYLYALSLAMLAVLICLICVAMLCVALVRRVSRRKRGAVNSVWRWPGSKEPRRQSITIDLAESPKLEAEHIVMDDNSPKKLQLDRGANGNKTKSKVQAQDRYRVKAPKEKEKELQISPQKFYDGNFKSIVYDRVIRPRHLEQEMQQHEADRMKRDKEDFDAL